MPGKTPDRGRVRYGKPVSFKTVLWAFEQRPAGGAVARLLLLTLASYTNQDGLAWPSYARLADDCDVDRSTVIKHLAKLEEAGLLTRAARFTVRGQTTNVYRLACHADVAGGVVLNDRGGVVPLDPVVSRDGGGGVTRRGVVVSRDPEPVILEPVTEPTTTTPAAVAIVSAPAGAVLTDASKAAPLRPLPAVVSPTAAAIVERLGLVMGEIQAGTRERVSVEQTRKLQAGIVFAYYTSKFDHARALLDDRRERLIMKRLEENRGDVSELLFALDGARNDEWVMGTAPTARHKNDGVEYILRDRGHVEKFANTRAKYRAGLPHDLAVKYAAVAADEPHEQHEDEQQPPPGTPVVVTVVGESPNGKPGQDQPAQGGTDANKRPTAGPVGDG